MSLLRIRLAAGALAGAFVAGGTAAAYAHAVCGDRIFPATLAIDDPGVTDELTLPTVSGCRRTPTASGNSTRAAAGRRRSFPTSPSRSASARLGCTPGGFGWDALDTEVKYQFLCIPQLEFMASVGFDVSWGGTATGAQVGSPNMYSPVLDVGLGFGALPTSMNYLRPFAITGEISTTTPGQAVWNGDQFATTFNWGFTLQYSLPYFNSHVGEIDNDFLKHLIPTVEFAFSTPTANAASGTWGTTGTIQPGVVYMADKWQIAVEAVIPVNARERSRRRRGGQPRSLPRRHLPQHARQTDLLAKPAHVHRSPIMTRMFVKFAAALALACASTAAFAHAQLEKATPAVGGTVASASEIRLEFSEGVEPKFSKVSVTGPSGAVPLGAAKTEPAIQAVLIVPISKPLSAGAYKVHWQAVSVDTHHTQGTFEFTVKP